MRALFIALVACGLTTPALAAEGDFAGRWLIDVQIPAEPLAALLEIELHDGDWVAWVEGGPAPIEIDGNDIDLWIDSRDRQGFRFQRKLSGTLDDGVMSGTITTIDVVESAAEYGEDGSEWSARPYVDTAPDDPINSFRQLDGTWAPKRGVDFRKWTVAMTPAAKEWHASYDARMDEPQKRCIDPGVYPAISWSFPFEIVVDDDKVVMLYEAFNLVRRVFTDGRDDPDFYPNSAMGYSTGRLEDGEFVVHTKFLSQTIRDFNGEPISENAEMEERYRLSDDGNRLSVVVTLIDPDNYERPPLRRRMWTREDEQLIYPFECDPDSFFRQLFNEGRMQEYIDRTPIRP